MSAQLTSEQLSNIFRVETFDSVTEQVAARLKAILADDTLENVELEAKLGMFRDRGTNQHFCIHDADDGLTVMRAVHTPPYHFVAEIQEHDWSYLVKYIMNGRCHNYNLYHYEPRIDYLLTETIDEFYATDDPNKRVRVTKDAHSGEIIACICKEEIGNVSAHINILNNRGLYDCRVTAKREVDIELSEIPGYLQGRPISVDAPRRKVRHTFCIGLWSIDLTELPPSLQPGPQVYTMGQPQQQQQGITTYEVEIELRSEFVPMLKQALEDLKTRRNNNFYKIVRSLINTIQTVLLFTNTTVPPPLLCTSKRLPEHVEYTMKQFSEASLSTAVQLSGLSGESRM